MANIIPYREFLKRKELCEQETGITVSSQQLHPSLFDPFGGIGSTVYEAIKLGRKGMSIELKPSYWDASVNLMRDLEEKLGEATLF